MIKPLALIVLLAGCGARVQPCPAPMRSVEALDCGALARQVATLRVDLIVAFAGGVPFTQDPLPDPSAAFDAWAERLGAQCHAHNTCQPGADGADPRRAVAGVASLVAQVQAATDRHERARQRSALARRLEHLAAGGAPEAPARWVTRPGRPWMGTRAPATRPNPRGAPHLIGAFFALRHQRADGRVSWQPRLRIDLWWPDGAFALDDAVEVDWGEGLTSACPLGPPDLDPHHHRLWCDAPRAFPSTVDRVAAQVRYRFGRDGRATDLGHAEARILAADAEPPFDGQPDHFGVDHDPRLAHAHLEYRSVDERLPATQGERPHLSVVLRQRKRVRPTLRCTVDGAPLIEAQPPSRFTPLARFRDRADQPPRSWTRAAFALPFVFAGSAAPAPWPRVGAWRCEIRVGPTVVRRVSFDLDAAGRPTLADGAVPLGPAWPLPTAALTPPVEAPR